jgi:ferredoxin
VTILRVAVDRSRCSSIGICESIAPDYFEMGDDAQLVLHKNVVDAGDVDAVREAVRSCPAVALKLTAAGD